MKDLTMTVTGWVATDPKVVVTRDGSGPPLCTFRLAQTSRYYDRGAGQWTDANTEWFTVRVFRDPATLVADSIRKGQPVIVEGRLRTNEWTDAQNVPHWGLQLDATCVGHDLTKGTANFTRTIVTGGAEEDGSGEEEASDAALAGDTAVDDTTVDGAQPPVDPADDAQTGVDDGNEGEETEGEEARAAALV